jgi:hypothetical protein
MAAEYDHSCPEALYYGDCPKFKRRACDAINCWANYSWQERQLIERTRRESKEKPGG